MTNLLFVLHVLVLNVDPASQFGSLARHLLKVQEKHSEQL